MMCFQSQEMADHTVFNISSTGPVFRDIFINIIDGCGLSSKACSEVCINGRLPHRHAYT